MVDQNSSSIRLQWNSVQYVTTYLVECRDSKGSHISSTEAPAGPAGQAVVNYTASPLRSATSYRFTVYSRLGNFSSSGRSIHAVTGKPLLVVSILMVTQIPSSPW